jgi:aspartyl-tRNA(Asn)/glutamyl-tRNA(Gln) amidotransferase subunit A
MDELAFLSVAEASTGVRDGSLSPVRLVECLLERIERLDPLLHSYLFVDAESSLQAAKTAEREIAAGGWRGPLHGVPIAVKDIIDLEGQPTTCHSLIGNAEPALRDAAVIRQLRDAGAILIGKTALHEFATGGPAFDLPWPPARNPWNPALHPGGSSSGSGAAVAAGLAMAAIGTDTGGSVRNPATCCGVVGLKPTYDLVSRAGVFPLSFSLDHVGFLSRSAEDCAILLDATATPASHLACNRFHERIVQDTASGIRGLRIGVISHYYKEDAQADTAVVRGLEDALEVFRGLGATLVPVRLSPLQTWSACGRIIQQAEQYVVHEAWLRDRPQDYCALSRGKLVAGAFLGAAEYVRALQVRRLLCEEYAALMESCDAVATVSGMTLPCAIDDPGAIAATYERHARMPFNVTGAPAMSLPVGFSESGMPLGLQLAARPYAESTLLRIAAAYEAATRWRDRRPALAF